MTESEFMLKLTAAQREAMWKLQKDSGIPWDDFLTRSLAPTRIFNYVGIPDFHGMFVGIEDDGYVHT